MTIVRTSTASPAGDAKDARLAPLLAPSVYIVDDDPSVLDALVLLLSLHGLTARAFLSAEAFGSVLQADPAGCLLLDVRLPGKSGLELQAELLQRGVLLPVVFVTGHGDVEVARTAFRNGAVDLLEKPIQEDALLAAVRKAMYRDERRRAWEGEVAEIHTLMTRLTAREHEVLSLFCDGYPNREVARILGLSPRTVEVHRGHVMGKLHVGSLAELLRLSRMVGTMSRASVQA